MAPRHPVLKLADAGLPDLDFGVLFHGLLPHGRDYEVIAQFAHTESEGTYRLRFSHVVSTGFETRVRDDVWPLSWEDSHLDYETGVSLDGYLWGVNMSLAYPGLSAVVDDTAAAAWTARLDKPMFAAVLETNQFWLRIVFHDLHIERLDGETDPTARLIIPLEID